MYRIKINRDKRGFVSFVGLLLTLAIIAILFYLVYNCYFKIIPGGKKLEKNLSEEGIDTRNLQTILDSTKQKVEDINKQMSERIKQTEQFLYSQ